MNPDITIQYAAEATLAPRKKLLEEWVMAVLSHQNYSADVTLRIVDVAEMTQLNETYRHKKGATNVLSFPAELPDHMTTEFNTLGDIVICAAVVNREATEQQKANDAHWAHMVVHGVFHLLGYDHENEADALEMETLEITVLKKLGFNNPYENGEVITHHD